MIFATICAVAQSSAEREVSQRLRNTRIQLIFGVLFCPVFLPAAPVITPDATKDNVTITATLPTDKNFFFDKQAQILLKPSQNIIVTLTGNFDGSPTSLYGAIGNASNNQIKNINGRNSINFTIDTTAVTGTDGAIFFAGDKGTMTFDTNLDITLVARSNIGKGVFLSAAYKTSDPAGNDQVGIFEFKKGLSIDTTSTRGSQYIFNIEQEKGEIYVNYQKNGQAWGNNTIMLMGDFAINGGKAVLGINLNTQNSYMVGKEDYTKGTFNLTLSNGGKWRITEGDAIITNLNISNNANPTTHPDRNSVQLISGLTMIDTATPDRIAQGFGARQNINIDTLSGNNGVFRIMIDFPKQQGDRITIKEKSQGAQTHYIQLLQNKNDLSNITQTRSLIVAEIFKDGDDLTFNALPVTIGLYDYKPLLTKEKRQGDGYQWVLYHKVNNPNQPPKDPAQVQEDLKRWMSLQYRIYRIQIDSINKHIDELVPTYSEHHVWVNYFLGKQGYGTSSDNYQTIQAGYDWGLNTGNIRHLIGGFLDYTKMKDFDIAYNGDIDGMGIAAYYQMNYLLNKRTTLDFDFKMKYNYNALEYFGKGGLNGANFVDSYHLFYVGARIGSKIGVDKSGSIFVEPSGEARIGIVSGGFVNIIDQITQANFGAEQDSAKITSAKLNFSVGKKFEDESDYWDIRGRLYYAFDSNTGGDITLIDVNPANRLFFNTPADHRMGIGIDTNASINNVIKLYGSFERTFFSNYNTIYLLYFGVRVSFNSDGFSNRISRPSSNVIYQDNMRQDNQKPRKGKIIFGKNARPLPKLLTK